MPSLLGIDCGLTVTKAVVFDVSGRQLSVARRRIPQLMPKPHHVERDMHVLWQGTAEAIKEAIAASGRPASDIAAVAATAHGDGLYLLDQDKKPLGAGILSLDSRTAEIIAEWNSNGVAERALELTGQMPTPPAYSSLLAWIKRHDPERFACIGHVLSCKDYLRFCLTGQVATDRTEASVSFTDVKTQKYSDEALALFGLTNLRNALPPVFECAQVAGQVTAEAATLTGLVAGTPVAAGLHDVTASALGMGGHKPGTVAIVAGTYSINQVVSDHPVTGAGWLCRNAVTPGLWNSMAISPASSANYDWFLDTLAKHERDAAGASIHEIVSREIEAALAKPSSVLFHPYLFGSPFGPDASAAFFGLRGWHDRGTMLRAVLEGVIFNHRLHIDDLRGAFSFAEARLTGGPTRNPLFNQLFADILQMPVTVTETDEAASWGAALCAGAAVGLYPSPLADPRDLAAISRVFQPDPARAADVNARYALFLDMAAAMQPFWQRLEALS
ncbi:FGGY-family carbohydrate kinase [Aestuariivirga litoralis]|uniref:FGGY-family carbohydrate kinase n=1 Tax=Aestuariivirga litoralis TaxID=2650924 RepID=UPI0018C601AF|nr:FGGY-family carbohydrate kinase [Aestuariivirga litoralis]MBG1232337.1 carbohydrate kinase [Aestuariivirga litoralis]